MGVYALVWVVRRNLCLAGSGGGGGGGMGHFFKCDTAYSSPRPPRPPSWPKAVQTMCKQQGTLLRAGCS